MSTRTAAVPFLDVKAAYDELRVELDGFATYVQAGLNIQVDVNPQVNVSLRLAAQAQCRQQRDDHHQRGDQHEVRTYADCRGLCGSSGVG